MKANPQLMIAGVVVLICIGIMVWHEFFVFTNPLTRAEAESAVRQNVHKGETRAQVDAWLTAWVNAKQFRDVYPAYYVDAKEEGFASSTTVTDSGIPVNQLGGYSGIMIPDTYRAILNQDTQLVFYFDKQGKFINFVVWEFGNGP